jgi:hypothetical protein
MKNHFYYEKIETFNFCNTKFYQVQGGEYRTPYAVNPTEGTHDYKKCEGCIKTHLHIYENVKTKFDAFPFCCDWHSKIAKEEWYNKAELGDIPKMVADKVIFMNQHIINNYEKEDWHTEIRDYFQIIVHSFGNIPYQFGEPLYLGHFLEYIEDLTKSNKSMEARKKGRILDLINSYKNQKQTQETDLRSLSNTYNRWIKLFPFELSYFSNLKKEYEDKFSILFDGKPEINRYSGQVNFKLYTNSDFIEKLISLTKDLLLKVDNTIRDQIRDLNDLTDHSIRLAGEKHKIKQDKLLFRFTCKELSYVKILDEWLKNEKSHFKELIDIIIIRNASNDTPKKKTREAQLSEDLKEYGFFELSQVKFLNNEKQKQLIQSISLKSIPYKIAMLDFIGFMQLLKDQYSTSQYKIVKILSQILNEGKNERLIKGNIAILSPKSREDKKRFTAHLHKEQVEMDYKSLL